jgi:hypothetical protein
LVDRASFVPSLAVPHRHTRFASSFLLPTQQGSLCTGTPHRNNTTSHRQNTTPSVHMVALAVSPSCVTLRALRRPPTTPGHCPTPHLRNIASVASCDLWSISTGSRTGALWLCACPSMSHYDGLICNFFGGETREPHSAEEIGCQSMPHTKRMT